MATPVRQGAYSGGRCTGGSPCSGAAYLYAELQHAGARNPGASAQPVPHTPRTPRALTQTQQRNVVRQWQGLPPSDETRLQRASRQAGLAAGRAVSAAENLAARMAGQAAAGMRGICSFTASFIQALPDLHIGPPGAAARQGEPQPADVPAPSYSICKEFMIEIAEWEKAFPAIGTVEAMLAACPGVDCSDDAIGELKGATVVIENGEQVRKLAAALAARGATVFLSPAAMDAFGDSSACLQQWFGASHARLDNVTPGDWTPAAGGSVVLLSSQEFAGKLASIRKLAYPSCTADALACAPAAQPVPASMQAEPRGRFAREQTPWQIAFISFAAVAAAIGGGGLIYAIAALVRLNRGAAAQGLTNVVAIPVSAANAGAPSPAAPAAPVPAGTTVTPVPAAAPAHTPTYDSAHPPAGMPGGD